MGFGIVPNAVLYTRTSRRHSSSNNVPNVCVSRNKRSGDIPSNEAGSEGSVNVRFGFERILDLDLIGASQPTWFSIKYWSSKNET